MRMIVNSIKSCTMWYAQYRLRVMMGYGIFLVLLISLVLPKVLNSHVISYRNQKVESSSTNILQR